MPSTGPKKRALLRGMRQALKRGMWSGRISEERSVSLRLRASWASAPLIRTADRGSWSAPRIPSYGLRERRAIPSLTCRWPGMRPRMRQRRSGSLRERMLCFPTNAFGMRRSEALSIPLPCLCTDSWESLRWFPPWISWTVLLWAFPPVCGSTGPCRQ